MVTGLLSRSDSEADEKLLSEAVCRVAQFWKLSNETLARILGISSPTVSRLRNGKWLLEAGSKPFELSQFVVRLFRSLDAIVGSDDEAARSWLLAENAELRGRPLDMIQTIRGLIEVADYVDDYRAKV